MKYYITILLLWLSTAGFSQEKYAKARIWASSEKLSTLAELGVPVDHGTFKQNTYLISDFSESELAIIENQGIQVDILIEDVQRYYQQQLATPANHASHVMGDPHIRESYRGGSGCSNATGGIPNYTTPSNFSLGSMGGYLTYNEFLTHIDAMANQYPNLITTKDSIGPSGSPFMTHENRPIFWMRISDNPNTNEPAEPEILYTAIHHAREPASLSQTIFYMWYLLENYGTDPEVTYLVDNTEMYFVPCINPDGYIYNETTNPNGGGMWRKNRRNNGSGSFGVDLNRNYAYQWGVSGASTDPTSDTYMGPNSFSEPETQAIQWLTFEHDFEIALNYHTYGGLLLHPFGYANVQSADHSLFQAWSGQMVRDNGYANILSADLYPAAGDSDDYMYADDLTNKPKIFAMTPEVGENAHGFWPASSEIERICKEMVTQNLTAAHLLLNYGIIEDTNPQVISASSGYFTFDVTHLGMDNGGFDVSIAPYGTGVNTVGNSVNVSGLNQLDVGTDSISYTLDPSLQAGQSFQYILELSNGMYTWRDTITKIYGQNNIIVADDASNMNNWSSNDWFTTSNEFYSPGSSITDSPGGEYFNMTTNEIELVNSIDLTNAIHASISFYAKWEIETGYDYCQLLVSNDGGTSWTPMCGKYTKTGSSNQDQGNPVWDGFQTSWVKEEINLEDFAGQTIELKFVMVSDPYVTEDGFYFDDFEVSIVDQQVGIEEKDGIEIMKAIPNPANEFTYIQYDLPNSDQNYQLLVRNTVGQVIKRIEIDQSSYRYQLNTGELSNGVYFYQITGNNTATELQKLIIAR